MQFKLEKCLLAFWCFRDHQTDTVHSWLTWIRTDPTRLVKAAWPDKEGV